MNLEFGHYSDEWILMDNGTQVHKTALVAPWVIFGDNCIVHPYAVIGRIPDQSKALARSPKSVPGLKIGSETIIGCHSVIYATVIIGNECLIGDGANVREGTVVGNKCVIGAHVSISYNVKIGNRCRFQNGTVIVGETCINDGCFFGPNVTTSNDRNVDLENYHFPHPCQPIVFGKQILVGSGSNILAGIIVSDKAVIGVGAVVVKNVGPGERVLGPRAKIKEESEIFTSSIY